MTGVVDDSNAHEYPAGHERHNPPATPLYFPAAHGTGMLDVVDTHCVPAGHVSHAACPPTQSQFTAVVFDSSAAPHPVLIELVCADASHDIAYTPKVFTLGVHCSVITAAFPPVSMGNAHDPFVFVQNAFPPVANVQFDTNFPPLYFPPPYLANITFV